MTGKLPTECLIKIFKLFRVTYNQEGNHDYLDYVTLRSCALVNRQWCSVAIPMLWKEPLANLQLRKSTRDRIHLPIRTYIMCLSDEAKIILSKCGITSTLKRGTMFDYASFLQRLDNVMLSNATERWIEMCNTIPKDGNHFISIFQNYQLIEQLLRMFMMRCKNLKELRLKKSNQLSCPADALLQLHLLPGAEVSLSALREFSFDGCMQSEILSKASEISKNIQHLQIDCVCNDNEGLAKLIRAQQKPLLGLSIESMTLNIPNIKNALKNKVNSLTSLSINRIFSLDIFSNCSNLETLIIMHRERFVENLMERFVNSKFPKLRELQLQIDHPYLYQISTLIKNTNENLTSIYLNWVVPEDTENILLLFSTITTHCPNLTEYLGTFSNDVIPYLPLFFEKCSKLEYFYVYDDNSTFYDLSNVMKLIANVIPKRLKMMWLSESWMCNVEALNVFLEGCEKRLCEPLLFFICNRTNQHIDLIRRYVVKNVLTANSYIID
ncbi:1294_t:CDS:1 [Funneliformis mosseae]|uniref:1294_t:CDS:1 n=1 Tax=Funneliformis mosseae TaxID=27381 RepID=A0A9N9F346_FUNMO|nr:1294_t:CDS:1 [Funneliformis mosseae]